jgi:hypothetical protein
MLIQLRLLKGRRNRGTPPALSLNELITTIDLASRPKIKFTERRDVPSFCLIKLILELAFMDETFAMPWIRGHRGLWGTRIPARLKSVPFEGPRIGWRSLFSTVPSAISQGRSMPHLSWPRSSTRWRRGIAAGKILWHEGNLGI